MRFLLLLPVLLISGCDQQSAPALAPEPIQVPAAPPAAAAPEGVRIQPRELPSIVQLPELDMSLPDELLHSLPHTDVAQAAPLLQPLLPPLFNENPSQPKPFQLQGRLILDQDEQNKDLPAVEGLQLELQISQ
jgi:hypothetical protein